MVAPTLSAVLYVDVDRMFYSCEVLERPDLAAADRDGVPVVVGRDPRESPRAIVTTANDAARARGIYSGLSTAIALKLAGPTTLFLPPRHDVYSAYSRRLMAVLREEASLVQQSSVDEAALDWSAHGFDPAPALRLRAHVREATGLSVSLGLARTPLVAKVATEIAKRQDDHLCVVPPGTEPDFLAPMPVRALVGIGPKAEARLRAQGRETIRDLQALPLASLVDDFGSSYGRYLFRACRGEDDAVLSDAHESKSQSAEHTFSYDTANRAELWRTLREQSAEVAARLAEDGLVAEEVAIKLRYANWETITRQVRLGTPTDRAEVLASGAAALMRRHWDRTRPVRLIGLRASRLHPPASALQLALPWDPEAAHVS